MSGKTRLVKRSGVAISSIDSSDGNLFAETRISTPTKATAGKGGGALVTYSLFSSVVLIDIGANVLQNNYKLAERIVVVLDVFVARVRRNRRRAVENGEPRERSKRPVELARRNETRFLCRREMSDDVSACSFPLQLRSSNHIFQLSSPL